MGIAIVGAGAVGCYAAYLLARNGFSVALYDVKSKGQIGRPVQCTGIFPTEIKKFVDLNNDFLVNVVGRGELFSEKREVIFNKEEYVLDRTKFDQYLLGLAVSKGVEFYPRHKLIGLRKNQLGKVNLLFEVESKKGNLKNKLIKITSPDLIIGVDGPNSILFQRLNRNRKRKYYYGLQAVVKGKFDKHSYQTYFGGVCPGFFSWVVPESASRARVGLAVLKKPSVYFDRFLQKLGVDEKQVISKQGGLIPIFDPAVRFNYKNIYLLGDAAGWVKATTGGGIVPAFYEVHNLVNCLVKKKKYQPKLNNLKLHWFIRKILNRFSNSDYDRMIGLLAKPKNKRLVETYSREKPFKLLCKLAWNEPQLVKLGRCLLK